MRRTEKRACFSHGKVRFGLAEDAGAVLFRAALVLARRNELSEKNTHLSFCKCFPYVCPEPVLVKSSFLVSNGAKRYAVSYHAAISVVQNLLFNLSLGVTCEKWSPSF
eukprot:COSAG06_NODE_5030_length_3777_cov_4.431485_7_plen_108_part_00